MTKSCQKILCSITLLAQHSGINCGKRPTFENSEDPAAIYGNVNIQEYKLVG